MIKLNVSTLQATREAIPANLRGLSDHTLTNLQTELNPVPVDLIDIEYWPEIVANQTITNDQKFGDEIFVINSGDKTVSVSRQILNKTGAELSTDNGIVYDNKEAEIIQDFDSAVLVALGKYTSLEVDSWYKQEKEARDWTADNLSPTPLLDAVATARGTTLTVLASQIITKANAFEVVYGSILGKKQKLSDELYVIDVNLAGAIDLINAINW